MYLDSLPLTCEQAFLFSHIYAQRAIGLAQVYPRVCKYLAVATFACGLNGRKAALSSSDTAMELFVWKKLASINETHDCTATLGSHF
jgi:hypothetical protein